MNEREIFLRALEFDDAGRRADYLKGATGTDEAARARIEALLREHFATDSLLSEGRMEAAEATVVDATDAGPAASSSARPAVREEGEGSRIGRYRLLQRIGEGGFGEVYLAEQEEPVRRRVALKLIKLGMDTREVVARFEAERQALALMDHPCIARVFDGGATPSGRPFFVMELVRGRPVTEYCEQRRMGIRERLELFVRICDAVQHAHQKGVVHRDLKPSNVLVEEFDGQPHPKVIDFGVAKATSQRLTDRTLFTRFEQIIGTPAYMSPEQAGPNRDDVDTRSDVYSLGVLLYELLAGRTPLDARQLLAQGYDAILRAIREVDPPRLSARLSSLTAAERSEVASRRGATPERLGRQLQGELEWVVRRALEKDRARRYGTAAEFGGDLVRYLRHEPVVAAPPSVLYQARRFVQRHRLAVGVTAGTALLLALSTGLAIRSAVVEGRQNVELAAQRDEARRQTEAARDANERTRRAMGELSDTLSQLEIRKHEGSEQMRYSADSAGQAIAQLARSVRRNPADFRAASRLQYLLNELDLARPMEERLFDDEIVGAAWAGAGLVVATRPAAGTNAVVDAPVTLHGAVRTPPRLLFGGTPVRRFGFWPDGKRYWAVQTGATVGRWRIRSGAVAGKMDDGPAVEWAGKSAPVVVPDAAGERSVVFGEVETGTSAAALFDHAAGRQIGTTVVTNFPLSGTMRLDPVEPVAILRNAGRIPVMRLDFGVGRAAMLETLDEPRAYSRVITGGIDGAPEIVLPSLEPDLDLDPGHLRPLPLVSWGGQRAYPRDGRKVAAWEKGGRRIGIWDLAATAAFPVPLEFDRTTERVYFPPMGELSADGSRLAGFEGTNAVVWDTRTGRIMARLDFAGRGIESLGLAPGGEKVLLVGQGLARLFRVADGRPHGEGWGRQGSEATVEGPVRGAFAKGDALVVTWTDTGSGEVRRADDLRVVGHFGPHGGREVEARMSADGRRVVTWGEDSRARVWDPATGREAGGEAVHGDRVLTVELDPESRFFLSGSRDGTARMWSLTNAEPLGPPLRMGWPVTSLAWLAHDGLLAGAGARTDIQLWSLKHTNLVQTGRSGWGGAGPVIAPVAGGRMLLFGGFLAELRDPATLVRLGNPFSPAAPAMVRMGRNAGRDVIPRFFAISPDASTLARYVGDYYAVLGLPVAESTAPEWLPDLAEARVLRRITAAGLVERIPFAEALSVLERMQGLAGETGAVRWARWLAEPGSPRRPLHHGTRVTPEECFSASRFSSPSSYLALTALLPHHVPLLERQAEAEIEALLHRAPFVVSAVDRQRASPVPGMVDSSHATETQRRLRKEAETVSSRRALHLAARLLELEPDNRIGWNAKAVAHAARSETNELRAALAHGGMGAPTNAAIASQRGRLFELAGLIDEAEGLHARAVRSAEQEGSPAGLARMIVRRMAFLNRHGRTASGPGDSSIPRRETTDSRLIDLEPHYRGLLPWPFETAEDGDDLAQVPSGVSTFAGVPFDVRGVLEGEASGIRIGRRVQRLHFLHGARHLPLAGDSRPAVARYVVHYADGTTQAVEMVGGRHVRDWFLLDDEPAGVPDAELAWIGTNARSRAQGRELRLFRMAWTNPRPEVEVARLDLEVVGPGGGVFLLGVTADDGSLPAGPPQDPVVVKRIADRVRRGGR